VTRGERKRHINFLEEKDGATDFNQIKRKTIGQLSPVITN
jgi:hypothetical protein